MAKKEVGRPKIKDRNEVSEQVSFYTKAKHFKKHGGKKKLVVKLKKITEE